MARRRKKNPIALTAGWAIYFRTSDKDAQNPENSQRRQRYTIERSLLEKSDLPIIGEYIDNYSGRYANREGYQQMLSDARAGQFSHVAVENAERFGRNDAEALTVIDELDQLGIAIRFADYPELNPVDPDDRILISLSFTLARRESIKLGQRVSGGLLAKMRHGGYVGRAPDGYINCEEKADQLDKTMSGRYRRWMEVDPDRGHIWRTAWDLLLTEQYTLHEICEELHAKGFTYRTGRPFIEIKQNRKNKSNRSTLSAIFHNWTYAGWVWSDVHNIAPKTLRGNWEPIVSTEEFEKGLAILAKRSKNTIRKNRHRYLLSGLIYLQENDGKLIRMTCSTSNPRRSGGGTAHYRLERERVHFRCKDIDGQIPHWLRGIQIDPDMLNEVQVYYTQELDSSLFPKQVDKRKELEELLNSIDEEEKRTARLYATGKITDSIWDTLWKEWQDRRQLAKANLNGLEYTSEHHISNLNDALNIISRIGVLYGNLKERDQKRLLHEIVHRVVINNDGNIIRMELLSPFAYLHCIRRQLESQREITPETTKASQSGSCSSKVRLCGLYRTRTCNLLDVNETLCQLS